MRRVLLESPWLGDVAANFAYAVECLRDSLRRGESPIASHVLLAHAGVLDDLNQEERATGIAAGFAWRSVADATIVYVDRGVSAGMEAGIADAAAIGQAVEFRRLVPEGESP